MSLVFLTQARVFPAWYHRTPLLVTAAIGLVLVLGFASISGSGFGFGFAGALAGWHMIAALGGLLVLAAVSVGYGLFAVGRVFAPLWGRTRDIVEIALIVSVLPLAAWASGLFTWIRAIKG